MSSLLPEGHGAGSRGGVTVKVSRSEGAIARRRPANVTRFIPALVRAKYLRTTGCWYWSLNGLVGLCDCMRPMRNAVLCEPIAPPSADVQWQRRWTLREDNHAHHHCRVRVSESPLYLCLSSRRSKAAPKLHVGWFRLDLAGLLRAGYVRHDPIDLNGSDLRLRIVHADDGFYVQWRRDQPRLLMTDQCRQ